MLAASESMSFSILSTPGTQKFTLPADLSSYKYHTFRVDVLDKKENGQAETSTPSDLSSKFVIIPELAEISP